MVPHATAMSQTVLIRGVTPGRTQRGPTQRCVRRTDDASRRHAISGHLWHGDETHRRYVERNAELARAAYDPESHLVLTPSGSWQWREAPSGLREWMVEYFASRQEDGEPAAG